MHACMHACAGAWYNKLVKLFLADRQPSSLAPEFEGGFLRFPFLHDADADPSREDWVTAYHGTSRENAGKIFFDGQLRRPGHGAQVAHGQAGSLSGGRTIYVSPAKELSAFPVYSQLFQLKPHLEPATDADRRAGRGELVSDKSA
jgi:hypothetical protein